MKTLEYIYQETEIHFLLSDDENVMINATEMARPFGREVKDFNKLESTNRFIEACLISEENSLIDLKDRSDFLLSVKNQGTYMHRILALKFAAWLDVEFEIWIYARINDILFGNYSIHRQKSIDIIKKKRELRQIEYQIQESSNELASQLLQKQQELKVLENEKAKALKDQTIQYSINFETND